jgi:uncharacterized protein YggE
LRAGAGKPSLFFIKSDSITASRIFRIRILLSRTLFFRNLKSPCPERNHGHYFNSLSLCLRREFLASAVLPSRSGYDAFLEETMKFLKIAVAFCVLTGLAAAEDKLPARFVRVVGTSEVKVVPDRAVIEVGVEKQDPSASAAKHAEDAAARAILATLRGNGIDDKDIQTTFLSLQPQSRYVKKVRVSYFIAQQTLTIMVRDLARLDTLLEALIKAGGNRIDSIGYETSDLRKYRDQARDLAVKAAREKAEALAKALGQDIGKAHSIEEVPDYQNSAGLLANASYEYAPRDKAAGPSIAVGQKTVSASVTVAFELN